MNANAIINDQMTIEEKLQAIADAMQTGAELFNLRHGRPVDAPVDPADLTMCEGCQ